MEVYLDNAATTRCSEAAVLAMESALQQTYGNPSSLHNMGMDAERIIKSARETIAKTLHAKEKEIIFTSGGTESNNLAIFGSVNANKRRGKRILTSAVEHPSVKNPMKELAAAGFDVVTLPVQPDGRLELSALSEAVTEDTILLSLMQVNNEIGTIEPVEEAIRIVRESCPDIAVHVDAIQSYGKLRISPEKLGIDFLSVSAHKLHGPKGVGFLYARERAKLQPLIFGGGQQRGMRSGTENVPGIAGLCTAAEELYTGFDEKITELTGLRESFVAGLKELDGVKINGSEERAFAAPHIVSLSVEGVRSEVLLHALENEGIYVSAGSACSSNKPAVSETLKAIGLEQALLDSTIRFSLSVHTTEEELKFTLDTLKRVIPQLRKYVRH